MALEESPASSGVPPGHCFPAGLLGLPEPSLLFRVPSPPSPRRLPVSLSSAARPPMLATQGPGSAPGTHRRRLFPCICPPDRLLFPPSSVRGCCPDGPQRHHAGARASRPHQLPPGPPLHGLRVFLPRPPAWGRRLHSTTGSVPRHFRGLRRCFCFS